MRAYLGGSTAQLYVGEVEHLSRLRRVGGDPMCHRGRSETVAYSGGEIYPCCVGPGLDRKVSFVPDKDWREQLSSVHPPCDGCFFSGT